jgi:zinc transport system permease protein
VLAIVIGLVASVSGLVGSFYVEVPPGPTIVLVALLAFAVLATIAMPIRRRRREAA